jgi:hypothetical protein
VQPELAFKASFKLLIKGPVKSPATFKPSITVSSK